ncbi:phenylacetaldoxime dehydratase family protein [Bradyrhizobium sp. CB1650]|uniref:phenylacetaldoxime dehydratase family protein n=1 Tax=Bradyrhizobium sp. CB1650 TaxID=3039153 RepID=UPI002435981E|nr:phenylacetaldoxime dehydratase family protein [Bradyrhizobium sp. CB1650]WGD56118.1 phenylacetaldoxime dehydratase family protein [Bradyrhizobium sp. CB1650]
MESAIPPHLETKRSRHKRVPDDYQPPYPSFVARYKPGVDRVVMAYFGVQYRGALPAAATETLAEIDRRLAATVGPSHWDRAHYVDQSGHENNVSVAYWDDIARFDAWFAPTREVWTGSAREGIGTFIEVLRPAVARHETLFSSPGRPEGVAAIADGMSGEVQEHAYWGGMRDRIPLSQTDAMTPGGDPKLVRDGARLRVVAHDNLCLIRSGQDWSDTEASERKLYLDVVEPVLREGMDFLRDDGLAIGCYANRYMRVFRADGGASEKSYGQSWWRSLAALERWAESHPTHVKIFGAAMKYLSTLGPSAKLRLYHEVTVAAADEQFFEYLNCHPRTGMLAAVEPVGA